MSITKWLRIGVMAFSLMTLPAISHGAGILDYYHMQQMQKESGGGASYNAPKKVLEDERIKAREDSQNKIREEANRDRSEIMKIPKSWKCSKVCHEDGCLTTCSQQ
jgi:hypothetical protein